MYFKANCMILGSREFRIWPNVLLVNVVIVKAFTVDPIPCPDIAPPSHSYRRNAARRLGFRSPPQWPG